MFLTKLISKVKSSAIKKAEPYVQKYSIEPYDFRTVTLPQILEERDTLYDIYTNKVDGYLIKNFLTEAEVDTLLSNIDKIPENQPAYTTVGYTYPPIFAEFSNRIKNETPEKKQIAIDTYFEETTLFNQNFAANFGVDVKNRIENLFKTIAGQRDIAVAGSGAADTELNYPFATVRHLTPEKGLISVHCGNYFGSTFEAFYKNLTKKVAVENQMSFFIMLQEPEAGGELTLFNFRWKKGQTKVNPSEDNEIIQPDGSKMYVEQSEHIIKDKIKPKKGDMILFQGGNIWHRVETVRGQIPRVTLGGFIGISIDGSKFYYWS